MLRSSLRFRLAAWAPCALATLFLGGGEARALDLEICQERNLEAVDTYSKKLRNCLRRGADRAVDACAAKHLSRLQKEWRAAVVEARDGGANCSPGSDPEADLKPKEAAARVAERLVEAWRQVHAPSVEATSEGASERKADGVAEMLANALARYQRRTLACYARTDEGKAQACAESAGASFADKWAEVVAKAGKSGVDLPAIVDDAASTIGKASSEAVDEILTGDEALVIFVENTDPSIVDTNLGVDFSAVVDGEETRFLFWEIGQEALDDGADKYTFQTWRRRSGRWGSQFGTGGRIKDGGAPVTIESAEEIFCMRLIAHPAGDRDDIKGLGLSGNEPPCTD